MTASLVLGRGYLRARPILFDSPAQITLGAPEFAGVEDGGAVFLGSAVVLLSASDFAGIKSGRAIFDGPANTDLGAPDFTASGDGVAAFDGPAAVLLGAPDFAGLKDGLGVFDGPAEVALGAPDFVGLEDGAVAFDGPAEVALGAPDFVGVAGGVGTFDGPAEVALGAPDFAGLEDGAVAFDGPAEVALGAPDFVGRKDGLGVFDGPAEVVIGGPDFTGVEEGVAAVNPAFTSLTFTATTDGTPDDLDAVGTYGGSDPLLGSLELLNGATLHATVDLGGLAYSGGNFAFTVNVLPGDLVLEAGSTLADVEACDTVRLTISEQNNGGTASSTETVSGINVTAPVLGSLATNVAGTQVTGTFNKTVLGTETAANWTINGDTPDSVTFDGGTSFNADMTSNPIVNADTPTLDYSGGDITDEDGNALATISGASIQNNVPAAAGLTRGTLTDLLNTSGTALSYTTPSYAAPAGSNRLILVLVSGYVRADGQTDTTGLSLVWNGQAGEEVGEISETPAHCGALIYAFREADIPAAGTMTFTADQNFDSMTIQALPYFGVDQTTPYGTPQLGGLPVAATNIIRMSLDMQSADSEMVSLLAVRSDQVVSSVAGADILFEGFSGTLNASDHTACVAAEAVGVTGVNDHDFDFTATPDSGTDAGISVEIFEAA